MAEPRKVVHTPATTSHATASATMATVQQQSCSSAQQRLGASAAVPHYRVQTSAAVASTANGTAAGYAAGIHTPARCSVAVPAVTNSNPATSPQMQTRRPLHRSVVAPAPSSPSPPAPRIAEGSPPSRAATSPVRNVRLVARMPQSPALRSNRHVSGQAVVSLPSPPHGAPYRSPSKQSAGAYSIQANQQFMTSPLAASPQPSSRQANCHSPQPDVPKWADHASLRQETCRGRSVVLPTGAAHSPSPGIQYALFKVAPEYGEQLENTMSSSRSLQQLRVVDRRQCNGKSLQAPVTQPQQQNGNVGSLSTHQQLSAGATVTIGDAEFEITAPLGMGSYGMVWSGLSSTGAEVAIKEIYCRTQSELSNAKYEGALLQELTQDGSLPGSQLRFPLLESQDVIPANKGWKVRLAMNRLQGIPLMMVLEQTHAENRREKRDPYGLGETWQIDTAIAKLSKPCRFAWELVAQLAPTLEHISKHAFHRDVNPRNILVEGDDADVPQYGLVDFGMATDSQKWRTENGAWQFTEVGGDCRYWPVSAWIMFLLGPQGLPPVGPLTAEYRELLDIHALGVCALQVFIEMSPAIPEPSRLRSPEATMQQKLHQLQIAWNRYWQDVMEFWRSLIDCFSNKRDWNTLKMACTSRGVQNIVDRDLSDIRTALAEASAACRQIVLHNPGAGELLALLNAIRLMIGTTTSHRAATWNAVYVALGMALGDPDSPRSFTSSRVALGPATSWAPSTTNANKDEPQAARPFTISASNPYRFDAAAVFGDSCRPHNAAGVTVP
eukprot:CAMPEP_0178389764 /NCGR_PEP_ID=MMETSP0689_2-20121128/10294_1 /TAXON_ID=160604 /ORGANISM="Amphidinium massartii, Strain CS-259" /LENGTH=780 /DNA_ID=CAMNT_0020010243 /DNA_START=17 /DNA_END=2359 /DNA_ORIENTATION=-